MTRVTTQSLAIYPRDRYSLRGRINYCDAYCTGGENHHDSCAYSDEQYRRRRIRLNRHA